MPRYDFLCPTCTFTWEAHKSMNAPAPPCPSCGADRTAVVPPRVGFALKGGGWASEGYHKGGPR